MKPMGPESRAHRDLDVSAHKTAEYLSATRQSSIANHDDDNANRLRYVSQ